jgi:hypothetical protein
MDFQLTKFFGEFYMIFFLSVTRLHILFSTSPTSILGLGKKRRRTAQLGFTGGAHPILL